jgi:hypothetical protein
MRCGTATSAIGSVKDLLWVGLRLLMIHQPLPLRRRLHHAGKTGNVTRTQTEFKYAGINSRFGQIDANSFANLAQIQKMNVAMTMQGVILTQ